MKYQFLQAKFAKLLLFCAAFGVFFSAFVSTTQAQTVTFAQFVERNGSQDFRFTNNTTSGTFDTVTDVSPIFFVYQNIDGLDPSLQGSQNARLFITSMPTTTPAFLDNRNNLTQPLNQTVVISILRDTPTREGVGTGTRTNLLTVTISSNNANNAPAITGNNEGNSAAFTASTPKQTITYTSDFLNFSGTKNRNLGLAFSSVTPSLTLGPGEFLQSFTAVGAGTFASDKPPIALPVTTAASVSISGRVLTPSGGALRGARVNLTEDNGTTRTVLSNKSGYYYFSDVTAGQTAILSVNSKRYSYVPQVLTVTEDINDLNFTGQ